MLVTKFFLLAITYHICFSQNLEIKNLHNEPLLLLEIRKCKIQTGTIKIIHPVNLTNIENVIDSINKHIKPNLDNKLGLHSIVNEKVKQLNYNFLQIKPTKITRSKRWETLGTAWKWLAGNPDAEDLRIINKTLNELIDANNEQYKINEHINTRITTLTTTINQLIKSTTDTNMIIADELDIISTIINIDTMNHILEDIQDAIIRTRISLPSNRILTLKEIMNIKALLTEQGVNINLPDEALNFVTPKIATKDSMLLYILQIPEMEKELATVLQVIPLTLNDTIIRNSPQYIIKAKNQILILTIFRHNDF